MKDFADPRRIIGNILRLGSIESVDLGEATCRVRVGDNVTGDIPWWTPRAGAVRIWSPPTIGEQCMLFCAEGDTESGIAVTGLFSDANPAPSADPLILVAFTDGTRFAYDPQAHALKIDIAGGTAELTAPGGLTITADTSITGNLTLSGDASVSGTVTAEQDVVGGGKSLKSHRHSGVTAGSAQSGPPA